jgi:hypothetical protein
MKKIVILLFVISSIILTSSCKKEDDKTWDKSMLIGSWEQTGGNEFVACPNGDNAKIVFTSNDYTEYSTDEDGCVTEFGLSSNYTFDGKTIVLVNAVSYKITELTATSLSFNIFFEGYSVGEAAYVKM